VIVLYVIDEVNNVARWCEVEELFEYKKETACVVFMNKKEK